jgi:predicted ester cyclase
MKKSLFQLAIIVPLAMLLCVALSCQKKVTGGITESEAKAIGDWYLRARNEANLALLDKIYSPQVVVHDPSRPESIVGLEALKSQCRATHTAIPDVKFSLDDLYVKGDKIAWVFTMSGTVTGPFRTPLGDLPPTGKTFRFSGVAIDRIVEGKIGEEWVFYNVLDILQPMGFTLTPPQPPPSEVK